MPVKYVNVWKGNIIVWWYALYFVVNEKPDY